MATESDDNLSRQLCGMTEAEINVKHLRLRGSMELKYPRAVFACTTICLRADNDNGSHHHCFLTTGHKTDHEFSSECAASPKF